MLYQLQRLQLKLLLLLLRLQLRLLGSNLLINLCENQNKLKPTASGRLKNLQPSKFKQHLEVTL
jgi:hypothetical protein